jgi:hypothetical protein
VRDPLPVPVPVPVAVVDADVDAADAKGRPVAREGLHGHYE